MTKNKFRMPDFEGKHSNSFITKIELDETCNKIKVTRADFSVDELDFTEHNWNCLLFQMEQQVLQFINKNEQLIEDRDSVFSQMKQRMSYAAFVLALVNLLRINDTNQSLKVIVLRNAYLIFYAFTMLFLLDSHQNFDKFLQIMKQFEAFKKICAYQYFFEHKEFFISCEIENVNGEKEQRELLNINDIGLGNFTLEDLKRIYGEEEIKERKKVFQFGRFNKFRNERS